MAELLIEPLPARLSADNLVGGVVTRTRGERVPLRSPHTGAEIGDVGLSSAAEVDEVVRAAQAAFPGWRATPVKERAQRLLAFRDVVLRDLDTLANLAATEAGKTRDEARAGVLKGVEVVEFALSLQNLDDGAMLEVSRGVTCEVKREPLGVVAGIVPFNFPAMVPMWMFPIAVAVGNCFVLKPSEKVPLTACRLGKLMLDAGFPPGVFSLVHGARATVEALVDHPDVKALGFVGSTPAAKAVYVRATAAGKRALCLGGAKNVLMVAPDADPSVTVRGVVDSFTGCAGQRCMAASLMIAIGDTDKLVKAIAEEASRSQPGKQIGAIIDDAARERILQAIAAAEKSGAVVLTDGRKARAPQGYEGGNWLGATVLDKARPDMACAQTEIFGPVMTVLRAKTLDEALAIEASLPYGNATSIFTTSGAVARSVADRATASMIGVNVGVPVPREPFSFGGRKDSRFGHGDLTGRQGVDFWSDLKKVTTKWTMQADANWMS